MQQFFLGENDGKQLDVDDIDGDIQECSEPLALPFAGLQLASTQAAYFEEVFNTVVSTLRVQLVIPLLIGECRREKNCSAVPRDFPKGMNNFQT